MKKLLTFVIIFLVTNIATAELPNIVAIVNNETITLNEFRARKHMIMVLNNIEDLNKEQNTQLNKMALKSLIDELLLAQHLNHKKVPEKELYEAIRSIEERNNMPKGQLIEYLKSRSVDIESFKSQISNELLKVSVMSDLSRSVNISSKEIDTIILSSNQKDAQVSAQIFTSKNNDSKTFAKMQNLQKNLKNCITVKNSLYENFATKEIIDEKLSKLENVLQVFIKDLSFNQTSSVFEMNDKFKLIILCDKKILNMNDEENAYTVNFLTNKKTTLKALKFFENLRKKAYIKIMLPS